MSRRRPTVNAKRGRLVVLRAVSHRTKSNSMHFTLTLNPKPCRVNAEMSLLRARQGD